MLVITRVLVIAAVVAVLPMSVGFLLIQHSAKTRLTDAAGANFVSFAEQAAFAVDVAFVRELEFLSALAQAPAVQMALVSRDAAAARLYLTRMERASALYTRLAVVDRALEVVADTGSSGTLELPDLPSLSKSWASIGPDNGALLLARPVRDPSSSSARSPTSSSTFTRSCPGPQRRGRDSSSWCVRR